MKILIYGAGVIGSIYAAKLFEAKNNVTLLAREKRYKSLLQNGVIIREQLTGKKITVQIPLIQQLATNDFYDLIIVTVRLDQIKSVMADLKNNRGNSFIMLMLNNPENLQLLAEELKPKYLLFGFPGVGGIMKNDEIDFVHTKQQKTTIGDINQVKSSSLKTIKPLFENAGFETTISNNIDAWLKTHAIFISCICAAIIKENGDSIQLGKNKKSIQAMIKSIKEGFKAMKNLGIPIKPFNLKMIFLIMPEWFSITYWQKAMQSEMGTLAISPHANAAKKEMQLLAKKVLEIVHSSSVATPELDKLLSEFINLPGQ
ncbi:MAG: 2-dehydropantoate 2-reductase N-terminal domain-containing protein [Ginsengibacter sp.]